MTNSKHIPKRRFKEFELDGEWVQTTLKEVAENFEYGLNAAAKEFDGINKYIRITDIDDMSREFLQLNLCSPDVNLEKLDKYILTEGDVLFARTGASTGKTYYYKRTDGKVYFAGFLIKAKIKQDFDFRFIFQNTLCNMYQKYIEITSQRSGQPGVNAAEYGRYSLRTPSLSEQKKIGDFFQTIDSRITLHQHKLDKLKNLKKSYLAELFPVEGERVPKRRFPGFEGDWERKKVSELFKITRGYVLAATRTESNKSKTTPYPVYSSQTKDKGLMGFYSKYLYEDAITWTTDGANAGEVNFREGKFYCTNVCGVLLSKEVQADPMIAEAINNIAKKYVSYVGNPKLMNNVMADIEISIPQTSSEREKISQFFTDIDKRISLQQEKLDKLKDLKKAYLNELFV